jgi:hypothetical protein
VGVSRVCPEGGGGRCGWCETGPVSQRDLGSFCLSADMKSCLRADIADIEVLMCEVCPPADM